MEPCDNVKSGERARNDGDESGRDGQGGTVLATARLQSGGSCRWQDEWGGCYRRLTSESHPQSDGVRRGGGEVTRVSPQGGAGALAQGTPGAPCTCHGVGTQRAASARNQEVVLIGLESVGPLILDVQPPELGEVKVCCPRAPVVGGLGERPRLQPEVERRGWAGERRAIGAVVSCQHREVQKFSKHTRDTEESCRTGGGRGLWG